MNRKIKFGNGFSLRKTIKVQPSGFTLIETLVAMGVIAILGVILTQLFYTSLRGDSKAQLLGSLKQNGTSAIENMKTNIRNADQVVTSCSSTILIVKGGIYTRYRIVPEESNANGKILVDYPVLTPQDIDTQSELTSLCTTGIQTTPSSLTDDDAQSGVSVLSGSFQRNQLPGFKDSVTITFSLKPGVASPQAIAGQISPQTFTTSIDLR